MADIFKIPLINPLRFHHNTLTLGSAPNPAVSDSQFNTVHMDADFFIRTLAPYVKKQKVRAALANQRCNTYSCGR
jgi:hypothetical protein